MFITGRLEFHFRPFKSDGSVCCVIECVSVSAYRWNFFYCTFDFSLWTFSSRLSFFCGWASLLWKSRKCSHCAPIELEGNKNENSLI